MYSDSFHLIYSLAVLCYSIFYLMWIINKKNKLDWELLQWRLIPVLILFLIIGNCIPLVNLNFYSISVIITASVLFVAIIITIYVSTKKEGKESAAERVKAVLATRKTFTAYTFFSFLLISFLLLSTVKNSFDHINASYFEARLAASKILSSNEVFPLAYMPILKETANNKQQLMFVKNLIDNNYEFEIFGKNMVDSVLRTTAMLPKDTVFDPSTHSVRAKFYKRYVDLDSLKIEPYLDYASKRNKFYSSVNHYVETEIIPKYITPVRDKGFMDSIPDLKHFTHPLNYYSYSFSQYRKAKEDAKELLDLAYQLHQIDTILAMPVPFEVIKKNPLRQRIKEIELYKRKLLDTIKEKYSKIPELSKIEIPKEPDSANINALTQFHVGFLVYKERQYEDRYKKAQIIYRSYLVDSQRIGVYIFLVGLAVVLTALYFNQKDLRHFHKPVEEKNLTPEEDKRLYKDMHHAYPLPFDMPAKILYIQALVLAILLVPLVRPIKAEHIDPEKPYWMVNIQNWNTPVLTARISRPDIDPKPTNYITNHYDPTSIVSELQQLKKELTDNLKEINNSVNGQATSPGN